MSAIEVEEADGDRIRVEGGEGTVRLTMVPAWESNLSGLLIRADSIPALIVTLAQVWRDANQQPAGPEHGWLWYAEGIPRPPAEPLRNVRTLHGDAPDGRCTACGAHTGVPVEFCPTCTDEMGGDL